MATTFPRRRCRICKGWFRPNARKGEKQYACSKPECQLVRQIRNEEARLVRDPAYFRARRPKPRPGERTVRPAASKAPRSPSASYEEVRDHVMHKVIMLQLASSRAFTQKVADHDVHKVITAQLAIVVGLVAELARHDTHKEIDLDLIALHDRGRRLLAGGDRDGKAKPG
jgi:hypothetical protein